MTTISILVPQNRPGGLDVLLSGLARQTLPRSAFELVLIDDLHAHRADLVRDKAADLRLQVAHVPPHGVPQLPCGLYEPGHYQRALNTGLMHARGDLCLVLCDYTYLADDCLERHIEYRSAEQHIPKLCAMGTVNNVDIKPLMHADFPRRYGWFAMGHNPADHVDATHAPSYQPWMTSESRVRLMTEWLGNYTADLAAGKLDSFMWSVFGEPITPDTDVSAFRVWQVGRGNLAAGKQSHQICYLKNDSFRTDDLVAVNGWAEEMDGCHGHQDSELAGRLEAQLGMEFWLFPQARAYLFDPHGVAIIRGMRKREDHNLGAYQRKWNTGDWSGGSELDLRTMRERPWFQPPRAEELTE